VILSKKIVFIVICVAVPCLVATCYYRQQSYYDQIHEFKAVASCIKLYIKSSKGFFPESKDDLIKRGLLKIEYDKKGNKQYYVFHDEDDITHWGNDNAPDNFAFMKINNIDDFTIKYGFKIEDYNLLDKNYIENLINLNKISDVLLFEGPLMERQGQYLYISVVLYEEMLRYQKDKPAEVQKAGSGNGQ